MVSGSLSKCSHWELLRLPKTPLFTVFLSGESLEFPHFPVPFRSPLSGLDLRSCPSSSDTEGEFGECRPYPPLTPLQAAPACPFTPPWQPGMCQGWEEPKKGVLKEGSWDIANSPLSKQDMGMSLHIPPIPVSGCQNRVDPTGRGAGAEGTEWRDSQIPLRPHFPTVTLPHGPGDPLWVWCSPAPQRSHSLLIPKAGGGDTAAPQPSSSHRRTFKHCLSSFKTCSDPINSAYLNSN